MEKLVTMEVSNSDRLNRQTAGLNALLTITSELEQKGLTDIATEVQTWSSSSQQRESLETDKQRRALSNLTEQVQNVDAAVRQQRNEEAEANGTRSKEWQQLFKQLDIQKQLLDAETSKWVETYGDILERSGE
ncbi:MAG: hypothetical protein Q9184_004392 [Pyrenodesmia sp. 2 TL-2023]